MSNVDKTLDGRGNEHGEFMDHACIAQELKISMRRHNKRKWIQLDPDMREALEMIQHKVARILNGNPKHIDSWHDIQGYARLVERRLIKESKNDSD